MITYSYLMSGIYHKRIRLNKRIWDSHPVANTPPLVLVCICAKRHYQVYLVLSIRDPFGFMIT